MDISSLVGLGVFLALNFAAASSGAVFRPGAWYETLAKPRWTPPDWAFPAVWSVLYLLNAVSGWLVWQTAGAEVAGALGVYVFSLCLNAGWSGVFFGLRRIDLGLLTVAALWLSILGVAALFWPHSPVAAGLQLPYLAWVTIAAALNLSILRRNPRAAGSG